MDKEQIIRSALEILYNINHGINLLESIGIKVEGEINDTNIGSDLYGSSTLAYNIIEAALDYKVDIVKIAETVEMLYGNTTIDDVDENSKNAKIDEMMRCKCFDTTDDYLPLYLRYMHVNNIKSFNDFCAEISKLFNTKYADFEGCNWRFDSYGQLEINLFFDDDYKSSHDLPCFVCKEPIKDVSGKSSKKSKKPSNNLTRHHIYISDINLNDLSKYLYDHPIYFTTDKEGNKIVDKSKVISRVYDMTDITGGSTFVQVSHFDPNKIIQEICSKENKIDRCLEALLRF